MTNDTTAPDLIERLDGPIKQVALDLVAAYFGTSTKSLVSIPANPSKDADLILCEGIGEAARALEAAQERIAELEGALKLAEQDISYAFDRLGIPKEKSSVLPIVRAALEGKG